MEKVRTRPSFRSRVFRAKYLSNGWRGTETRSGPGSTLGSTARLRRILPELVSGIGATAVLDAACGASFWVPPIRGYVGVDIVPEAVATVAAYFPEREYRVADIRRDELPRTDLVLVRDVLAHLSVSEDLEALENLRRTGAVWLAATTFEGADNSADIRAGSYHEYDLEREPYSLGPPWLVVEDGYWEDSVVFENKYLGVWALI